MITMSEYIELIAVILTLFIIVLYSTYIMQKTRESLSRRLYLISLGFLSSYLLFELFFIVVNVEEVTRPLLLKALLVMYLVYFVVSFAYEFLLQNRMSFARVIIYGFIPFALYTFLNLNKYVFHWIDNTEYIVVINITMLLILIGILVQAGYYIARYRASNNRTYKRKQSAYYITAFIMPLWIIILFALEYLELKGLESIAFYRFYFILIMPVVYGIIVAIGIGYRLLDDMPVILDYIIEHMREGIIIADKDNQIVEVNNGFFNGLLPVESYETIEELMEKLKEITYNSDAINKIYQATKNDSFVPVFTDLQIQVGDQNYEVNVTVTTVIDKKDVPVATLLTFHDITELQGLQKAIEKKNRQLIIANQQLEEHMANISELYVEEERKNLMDEINDTLGHTMTEVLALLDLSVLVIEKNKGPELVIEKLEDAMSRSRNAIDEVRIQVSKYKTDTLESGVGHD